MSSQPDPQGSTQDPTVPDATADYRPAPAPGDTEAMNSWTPPGAQATVDHTAPAEDRPSAVTIDAPSFPPEVTQEYTPTPSAPPVDTGHRLGIATAQAPVGAFVPAAPQVRSGRYLLKKFHARGGMGEIWVTEDSVIGRQVALKKMRGEPRPDQKDQFLREAQVTGQLEHPGIVPVHELGVDEDGQPFYVMKFIQGHTLKEVIADYHASPPSPSTPLPPGARGASSPLSPQGRGVGGEGEGSVPREVQGLKLLQIFQSVCQAVAYAHARGVIHRDLKPDNVMVGSYGETLVLDWGLAKPVGTSDEASDSVPVRLTFTGDSLETHEGAIKGTPSYMSPEVAEGRVADVDQASDIYLLGATLYQILTGKRPREAKKVAELLEMARKTPPVPPRRIDRSIPRALEAICLKAMAHRKEDRYATAQALAEDVQRYLAGEPVLAYRENIWERAWRWIKRHRVALGRTAAALGVLGLVLFGWNELHKANARSRESQRQAEELKEQERARIAVQRFNALANKFRGEVALQDPGAEFLPFHDPARAEKKGHDALALLDPWGRRLERLPLPDEVVAKAKRKASGVLLLLADSKARRARQEKEGVEILALLGRAAALEPPTVSYHRLSAEGLRLLGEKDQAAAESRKADDPTTPRQALDHYLAGERHRTAHVRRPETQEPSKDGKPPPDRQNQLKAAIAEYREALKLQSDDYWSLFQLGHCYFVFGEGDRAVEALGACVALDPDQPEGWSLRGLVHGLKGQFPEAFADVNKALAVDSDYRQAQVNRGVVYWRQKKYDEALKDFEAVLQLPEDRQLIEGAFYRGQLYRERSDRVRALSGELWGWLKLVALRRADAHETRALAEFAFVAPRRPSEHPAFLHRARIRFGKGDFKGALEDVDTYLGQKSPEEKRDAAALARRGRTLRVALQQVPEEQWAAILRQAKADLERAVVLGERSAQTYEDLGGVQEVFNEIPAAVRSYTQGLKLDPKNVILLVLRGWAQEKLGQYDEAGADFAAALEIDPAHGEAHAGLGYVQACRGKISGGVRQASRAVLHGPGDYLVLHNVVCVYAKLAEKYALLARKDAKLSETYAQRARECEELALDLMRREVELWRRERRGPDPLALLEREAFPASLRNRPEYRELFRPEPSPPLRERPEYQELFRPEPE